MRSTVQLFNTAIARLGGDQIDYLRSAQEQGTIGQLCETILPHLLDLALQAHDWSFALSRSVLALLPADSASHPVFDLAYALPADCVHAIRLEGEPLPNQSPVWEIEGQRLWTNESPAVLLYVRRVTDPVQWPAAFADALAWALAGELASARLNDSQKQKSFVSYYHEALALAIARDLRQRNSLASQSVWHAARFGNGADREGVRW